MSYPVITIEKANELASILRSSIGAGGDPLAVCAEETGWVDQRNGHDYEAGLVGSCAASLRNASLTELRANGKLSLANAYDLESQMAGPLHATLSQLGMDMLEDEDFWRYLALFPFRWYLWAREPEMQPQDFGGYSEVEVESGTFRRVRKAMVTQLIFRTFLWGKIAFDEESKEPYSRATLVSGLGGPSIDIWHSHLIRTHLGQLGFMRHAFLDVIVGETSDPAAMKDPARKVEKLIARVKHNVLLDIYSKAQADSMASEQLSKV
jgi:hypothetical protein